MKPKKILLELVTRIKVNFKNIFFFSRGRVGGKVRLLLQTAEKKSGSFVIQK